MIFDLIIVGGGMVGAAFVHALRDTNLRIALIDATPLTSADDPRLIALNDNSVCFLKKYHLFEKLAEHAAAIKQVHVSEQGHFGVTRLKAEEFQLDNLGYVIPATYINS